MSQREIKTERASTSSQLPIEQAINILKRDVLSIVTVTSWAQKMGYEDSKLFSDHFRREFGRRPQPVLLAYRTRKTIHLLRQNELSNYRIARRLKFRNEKGLYQFVKNKTGYAPTTIANLSEKKLQSLIQKLDKYIIE
ncbi:helix-turn-helix domain-containing protein [Fodinibius halophilus]|uniref:AraC family transcriptional regulator n=1 Tax=Fodinibius halophilus TaxID=1736908 RepID=A0A6M1T7Q4_9BACT|nr:helix-turn-helix domain-containing protein [Fodinibius halophilus]NGP90089.1 AraC family transcriptional regulator [Fodinibius halophilus]